MVNTPGSELDEMKDIVQQALDAQGTQGRPMDSNYVKPEPTRFELANSTVSPAALAELEKITTAARAEVEQGIHKNV